MAEVSYYTKEGLEKLKEELQQLKTVGRANISKAIAEGALMRLECGARCFERYRSQLWAA